MADAKSTARVLRSASRRASNSASTSGVRHHPTAVRLHNRLKDKEANGTPRLYDPLDTNKPEIRLFEIHPASNPRAQVKVTLSTHDLPTAVRDGFIPLSYVWGKPTPTNTIRANGRLVRIRQTLATFLKHIRDVTLIQLRSEHGCGGRVLFWADALCVDQSSVDERNHQVGLMKRIYGGADICLGWIGEFEDDDLAVELIDAIYHDWFLPHAGDASDDRLSKDALDRGSGHWMAKYQKFWERNDNGRFLNRYWSALARLFETPYWGRVWTVQEHVLPKNFLLVLRRSLIPLPKAISPFGWIESVRSSPDGSLIASSEVIEDLSLQRVTPAALARLRVFKEVEKNIESVVSGYCLHASDPRDHIFGMLGLVDTQLVADYGKPTKEVWILLCLTWWLERGNLNFLQVAGLGHRSTSLDFNLPSWAPDWTYLANAEKRPPVCESRELPESLRSAEICFALSEDTLRVPGILVDEVATLSSELPKELRTIYSTLFEIARAFILDNGGATTQDGKHVVQALALITLFDIPEYRAQQSVFEEMDISNTNITDLHTLVIALIVFLAISPLKSGNPATSSREAVQNMRQLGLVLAEDSEKRFEQHTSENADGTLLPYDKIFWASLLRKIGSNERMLYVFHHGLLDKLEGEGLFTTKNGCIGLARGAKMGDRLAILAKYDSVVVLRSKGDDFELVDSGEVQGMDHKRIVNMEVEELRLV